VDLSGLVAPAVSAAWLVLDHYLLLQDARLDGGEDDWAVDLAGASIDGHLSLSGARYALHAPKLRTGGYVYLSDVRAVGTIRLDGARLGGDLRLSGATLSSATDAPLLAVNLQVEDSVFSPRGSTSPAARTPAPPCGCAARGSAAGWCCAAAAPGAGSPWTCGTSASAPDLLMEPGSSTARSPGRPDLRGPPA
jgi:hypothetical protein